jgi:hypothetical protein
LKHNSRPNLTTPPIQASLTEGWHIQAHWLYNCFHPKYPQVLGGYLIFLMTSSSSFWKKLEIEVPLVFFESFQNQRTFISDFSKVLKTRDGFHDVNRKELAGLQRVIWPLLRFFENCFYI